MGISKFCLNIRFFNANRNSISCIELILLFTYLKYLSKRLVMHFLIVKCKKQMNSVYKPTISGSFEIISHQNLIYCEIRNFRAVQFSRKCDFGKFARS